MLHTTGTINSTDKTDRHVCLLSVVQLGLQVARGVEHLPALIRPLSMQQVHSTRKQTDAILEKWSHLPIRLSSVPSKTPHGRIDVSVPSWSAWSVNSRCLHPKPPPPSGSRSLLGLAMCSRPNKPSRFSMSTLARLRLVGLFFHLIKESGLIR